MLYNEGPGLLKFRKAHYCMALVLVNRLVQLSFVHPFSKCGRSTLEILGPLQEAGQVKSIQAPPGFGSISLLFHFHVSHEHVRVFLDAMVIFKQIGCGADMGVPRFFY